MFENASLSTLVDKYRRLAPKAFKLLDLTHDEIFEALAVIINDPETVWKQLIKNYGEGYFDDVAMDALYDRIEEENEQRMADQI